MAIYSMVTNTMRDETTKESGAPLTRPGSDGVESASIMSDCETKTFSRIRMVEPELVEDVQALQRKVRALEPGFDPAAWLEAHVPVTPLQGTCFLCGGDFVPNERPYRGCHIACWNEGHD